MSIFIVTLMKYACEATPMEIDLSRGTEIPLYRQLQAALSRRIKGGELTHGTRLPSVRAMAKDLGVSLITVVQAYDALAADGLVHASVGTGTFVRGPSAMPSPDAFSNGEGDRVVEVGETEWQTALPTYLGAPRTASMQSLLRPARRSGVISLTSGSPDPSLFPVRTLGRLWHRAMVIEDPRSLQYGTPQGDLNLRTWIATHCSAAGIPSRAEDILITSGVQQAIDLVARTFVGPGDYVLVESPTFLTALDIFDGRGAKLLGVPVDTEGMRVDIARNLVARFHPKLIYSIPTAHNPTGTTMSEDRRRQLVDLAKQNNLLVLEDDSCSEFTYDGEAPPAIKSFDTGGHVVFIKGFSKTVVPGLRVGGMVAHGPLMARLTESKSIVDRFTSPMIQGTLWRYLSARQYGRDLETARGVYRRRRDTVLKALDDFMPEEFSWTKPAAGFNLWITLPKSISCAEAFEQALKDGVACGFGDLFLAQAPPPNGLRISFADKPEHVLEEGIRRLGAAMRQLLDDAMGRSQETEFVTAV